ncbi:hypothetical protein [Bradyrhizobium sp. CCBAU 53421]|uniref:hypothetical protein n=1 Tax=Bradyrhizobium sp. CCBAU 53421 TaxID=1325120 RepID=UPI00188C4435|nr:hypothetical protein [Bradyrhizobium sp. CCBAU 53421]
MQTARRQKSPASAGGDLGTLAACARVMEADGNIQPAEIKMLDKFSLSMTGLPLQYPEPLNSA